MEQDTNEAEQPLDLQTSYDRVARQYAASFYDELRHKPFDRALLERYAAQLRGRGLVLELGCGPGQIARYLRDQGLEIEGLDLSPAMVEVARELNPDLAFRQGTMLALEAPDASYAGVVAFYSLIHLRRAEVPVALREIRRVLQPGGVFLLAVHGGEGEVHRDEWFGQRVAVDATFFGAAEVASQLEQAGLEVIEQLERPPYDFEYQSQRLYITGRRT
jgi:SAM-dependent methyltransferase